MNMITTFLYDITLHYVMRQVALTYATILPFLITVAFFVLSERKVLAALQKREGPTFVGTSGVLQSLADGLKLLLKEILVPSRSNRLLFSFFPIMSFTISFSCWALLPMTSTNVIADLNFQILWLLAFSSLNVYSTIFSGWASNSKYALLGGLRAAAQLISYEISMFLTILPIIIISNSLNFTDIVNAQQGVFFVFPFLPLSVIFFISIIAETNRPPFDLPEAESELVSGYNVEYASVMFAFFFLAEYCSILVMASIWVLLFWGGWLPIFSFLDFIPESIWFSIKLVIVCWMFIFIRGVFPRYRYDQLMIICWKRFFPFVYCYFFFFLALLYSVNAELFFNSDSLFYQELQYELGAHSGNNLLYPFKVL